MINLFKKNGIYVEKDSFISDDDFICVADSLEQFNFLKPYFKDLIKENMIQYWLDFPKSLLDLAQKTKFSGLTDFIKYLSTLGCRLVFYSYKYESDEDYFKKAFIGFYSVNPEKRMIFDFFADCISDNIPEHCPESLKEVYSLFGGICNEIMKSGTLITPGFKNNFSSDIKPLSDPRYRYFSDMELVDNLPYELDSYFPFYESDGDVLCFRPQDDMSYWFGIEWYGMDQGVAFKTVDDMLLDFFYCIEMGKHFHAHDFKILSAILDKKTNQPIQDAVITIKSNEGYGNETKAGDKGLFSIWCPANLRSDPIYELTIKKQGYKDYKESYHTTEHELRRKDFFMEPIFNIS